MIKRNSICGLVGWLFVLIGLNTYGQQLPITNHYILNSYSINPAIAGTKPFYEIKSNHRYQWVGLQDAPRTYVLSATGPLLDNMGIGISLYSDNIGPIRQTGMQASYSYHLNLGNSMNLSFGLGMGFLHYTLDAQKIILRDKIDATISENVQSVVLPDAKFGMFFSVKDFFVGISIPQLIQSKINLEETNQTIISKLKSHYYLMGGYQYQINSSFTVEPSFLVKYVSPTKPQLDVAARVIYEKKVWLAGAYRTNDAFTAMLGCDFKERFSVGYSYDFTSSNLKNYSQGSHELMIGVKLKRKKGDKAIKEDIPLEDEPED